MKRRRLLHVLACFAICIIGLLSIFGAIHSKYSAQTTSLIALLFNIVGIVVTGASGICQLSSESPSGHEWEDETIVDPKTGTTAKEERDNRERKRKAFLLCLVAGTMLLLFGVLLQLIALSKQ